MVIKCKRIKRVKTFISHLMKMKTVDQHQQKTTVLVPPKKRTLLTLSFDRPSAFSGQKDRKTDRQRQEMKASAILTGFSPCQTLASLGIQLYYHRVIITRRLPAIQSCSSYSPRVWQNMLRRILVSLSVTRRLVIRLLSGWIAVRYNRNPIQLGN